jgi:tRNA-specific 2-thiouridylase
LSPAVREGEFECDVKIRSVHPKARAILRWQNDAIVGQFFQAQESITPGQAAVFYDGDRVMGGGWIE